jgi:hypothetical protein
MTLQEVIRHQASIVGRVTDARTGSALGRVRIDLAGSSPAFADLVALAAEQFGTAWPTMAERPDRTLSRADGAICFVNLPDGQYTLTASLPAAGSRYGTNQTHAQVSRDAAGTIHAVLVELTLPATTVTGRVSTAGGAPIMMAAVSVEGSGEQVWTDAQGHYAVSGIEVGNRNLVISAQGFQTARTPAVLGGAGSTLTVDVTLQSSGGA